MTSERFSIMLIIRRTIGRIYDKAVLWSSAKIFALGLAVFVSLPKMIRRFPGTNFSAPARFIPAGSGMRPPPSSTTR